MNTKRTILIALMSFIAFTIYAGTKTIAFNVMVSSNGQAKAMKKKLKHADGIKSVKVDAKIGQAVVEYDDKDTDVTKITSAFKQAGFYASPVGENCATKPGGCLNNKPTTTNTMR